MDRLKNDDRFATNSALADTADLRAAVVEAVTATPVEERALRRTVWTYVGAERRAGVKAGEVVLALTQMVEGARITPESERQTLVRQVILWCVEAYFGHLGGGIARPDAEAPSVSA